MKVLFNSNTGSVLYVEVLRKNYKIKKEKCNLLLQLFIRECFYGSVCYVSEVRVHYGW